MRPLPAEVLSDEGVQVGERRQDRLAWRLPEKIHHAMDARALGQLRVGLRRDMGALRVGQLHADRRAAFGPGTLLH